MSRSDSACTRVVCALVASVLAFVCSPAFAQTDGDTSSCSEMQLDLANPSPGAFVQPGGLIVEGIALDARAEDGTGIDRVDFFLDSRDAGGVRIGSAVPGSTDVLGPGTFHTTIQLPNQSGLHQIIAYARSSITGQETVLAVPVAVGKNPTVGGASTRITESCSGEPQPMDSIDTSVPPDVPAMSPAEPPTVRITPADTTVTLEIANPAPGDAILRGAYVIAGVAYDSTADEGLGIDRIDLFLGDRDQGGVRLGGATLGSPNPLAPDDAQFGNAGWRTTVDFPLRALGPHLLYVYAHSTVTDAETVATVPVTVKR